jgi:undecaprenyl-diphosphatase
MLPKTIQGWFNWVGGYSLLALVAVLAIVAGVWGFVELTEEVAEGDTHRFDNTVMQWVGQHRGPKWLEEVGRDMTALGGVAVLSLVTAAVAGALATNKKYHAMWLVLIATFGGLLISTTLKWIVDRDRPQVFEHRSHVYTKSFPSGHSMLSAVVYLTLGSLLTRLVPGMWQKLYLLGVALFLTFLVGVSRVYMGVHWPTDVLAGWTAGLVWAIICWLAARALQRRGKVEKDTEKTEDLPPLLDPKS